MTSMRNVHSRIILMQDIALRKIYVRGVALHGFQILRWSAREDVNIPEGSNCHNVHTPFSIIAILSARRAVESRCVMNMTVFSFSPDDDRDIFSIVSKMLFCACASSEEV